MDKEANEILLLANLIGGPQDDSESVAEGVFAINKRWSSIGVLQPAPVISAPEAARSVDAAVAGAVCVAVMPIVSELLSAVRAVSDWVGARPGRRARIVRPDGSSIELDGLSEDDQSALIQQWIRVDRRRP